MEEEVFKYAELAKQLLVEYGMKVIAAFAVLIAGLWVIRILNRTISKVMDKKDLDASLRPFLKSLFSALMKVMLVITVMSMIGIEMTSFVAILGAAGLAVGLALSGTLQNFAGGVMILILRPYKVGDFIEAQGFEGKVKEIQIFHTILTTVDNKKVIIPNGPLSSGNVINYSGEPIRRIDHVMCIAYTDDLEKAKKIMYEVIQKDSRVLKDPPPFVRLRELADSSVNLNTRGWVKTEEYWDVYWDMQEALYHALQSNGFNIPFPQMDVHIQKEG